MNILGTGLSGLVGSRIVELLSHTCHFQNLSLETGIDITNKTSIEKYISSSDASWVWHFAAMTNVDEIEKERMLGKQSTAWKVNVDATSNLVELCRRYNKRLLYLSTDYVFDGTKKTYTEEDEPNPQGWYAITKYEGEKLVSRLGDGGLIVRIANPYRGKHIGKPDFVEIIRKRLEGNQAVTSPEDQLFVPTFIDDIALALEKLTNTTASGIYHAVGSQVLSPYDVSKRIAIIYNYSISLVVATKFIEYFKDRAPRPFLGALTNDKISQLGVHMKTFDEGLEEVRRQGKS